MVQFELIVVRLDEIEGGELTDMQKKTQFLTGIHDRDFTPIITICRNDPTKGYDSTVIAIHAEAKRLGKLSKERSNNNSNNANNIQNTNYKQNNQNEGNTQETTKPLPPEVWAKLDSNQKKQWARGRKKEEINDKYENSSQYSKKINNANTNNNIEEENDSKNDQDTKEEHNDRSTSSNDTQKKGFQLMGMMRTKCHSQNENENRPEIESDLNEDIRYESDDSGPEEYTIKNPNINQERVQHYIDPSEYINVTSRDELYIYLL